MSFNFGNVAASLGNQISAAGTNLVNNLSQQATQVATTAVNDAANRATGALGEVVGTSGATAMRQTADAAPNVPASPQDDSAASTVGGVPAQLTMARIKSWMPWIAGAVVVLALGIFAGRKIRKGA
jgi:hypothetical protein